MEKKLKFCHVKNLVDRYDVFLFDLWGVIIEDDEVSPEIVSVINDLARIKKVFFVTNAPRPAERVTNNMRRWGFKWVNDNVISTSGDVALRMIHDEFFLDKHKLLFDKIKIYHLGADRNDDLCKNLLDKITNDINEANILLLSLYRDSYEDIEEFDDLIKRAIENEILILCANPDTTILKQGIIRYCPGYFSKKAEEYGGKVVYAGKPESEIFYDALSKVGDIKYEKILMIGDTFETDIIGAKKVGIDSAVVTTGNVGRMYSDDEKLDTKINKIISYGARVGYFPNLVTSLH